MKTFYFQINFADGSAREQIEASNPLMAWANLMRLLCARIVTRHGGYRIAGKSIVSIEYLGL